jgi:hypothetical protein
MESLRETCNNARFLVPERQKQPEVAGFPQQSNHCGNPAIIVHPHGLKHTPATSWNLM